MDDSALYPPNRRALSDTVIGDVMQRVRPPSFAPSGAPSGSRVSLSLQNNPFPSVHLAVTPANVSGCIPLPSLNPQSTSKRSAPVASTDASDEVELRRQRNRMHQARHKKKQRQKVEDLEAAINQLRQDVQELKLQREVLSVGVLSNSTVWNVAAEYFRMFRYGVNSSVVMSQNSGKMAPIRADAQRSFLLSTMTSSVVSETGSGVDALMENWNFVSKFHPDIDVQLVSLEICVDGFIVGRTLGRLTITENTLRNAFPHLVGDGEIGERAQLANKLLGQQLVMRGCVSFEWDGDKGKVVRLQHKADLLTPILELLGNLEAVSCVFDYALVTTESTSVNWDNVP